MEGKMMKKTYKVGFISYGLSMLILYFNFTSNEWTLFTTILLIIMIYENYQITSNFINNRKVIRLENKPTLKNYINYFISLFFREKPEA